MTLLLTGGCGYLGSRLLEQLPKHLGDERIRILDNLQAGSERALMDLPEGGTYEFIEGDILDPSVLRIALRDVDVVVHLAAIVHTPFSFQDPNWVQQVNHWGTSHLVEAAISNDVEHFVYASSGAVYGPGGPHSEGDHCQPNGAYAHSKRQAERTVEGARERGLDSTLLRFGMLYGPAPVLRFDGVANKFAKLAGVRKALTVYGDGTQTRSLLHVGDAADAVSWALEKGDGSGGETYNVSGTNTSINELVDTIHSIRDDVDVRHTEQDVRTHFSLELDPSRLTEAGWTSSRTLEEGLGALVDRFGPFESRQLAPSLDL